MPEPELIPHDRARFLVGEAAPVLLLPSGGGTATLPELRVDGGDVAPCEGWRIAARLAMTIVDGPGDDGLAVEGDAEDDGLGAWCAAVDDHGGALVLAFDGWDAGTSASDALALARDGAARGGAMTAVPPG